MTKIKKLKDHTSAQCAVRIYDNGTIDFISYTTLVIRLDQDKDKNRRVECTGTYSRTTIRQIGWFLREYAPDLSYYDMKAIARQGAKIM